MPNNAEILNKIFAKTELKFGLKLFTEAEINRLTFTLDSDKTLIFCPVSAKKKVAKPEEVIRQLMIDRLHYALGYPGLILFRPSGASLRLLRSLAAMTARTG